MGGWKSSVQFAWIHGIGWLMRGVKWKWSNGYQILNVATQLAPLSWGLKLGRTKGAWESLEALRWDQGVDLGEFTGISVQDLDRKQLYSPQRILFYFNKKTENDTNLNSWGWSKTNCRNWYNGTYNSQFFLTFAKGFPVPTYRYYE